VDGERPPFELRMKTLLTRAQHFQFHVEGPILCLCILVVGSSALASAGGDRRRFRTRQNGAKTFFSVVTIDGPVITRHESWVFGGSAADLRDGGQRIVTRGQHEHKAIRKETDIAEIFH